MDEKRDPIKNEGSRGQSGQGSSSPPEEEGHDLGHQEVGEVNGTGEDVQECRPEVALEPARRDRDQAPEAVEALKRSLMDLVATAAGDSCWITGRENSYTCLR